MHDVEAVFARRVDPRAAIEFREEGFGRRLVNANGAVALNVAVPANGAYSCAFAAEVSSEREQVHDLADRANRVLVLCQAHRPASDHAVALDEGLREAFDGRHRHAARREDVVPRSLVDAAFEVREAEGVFREERAVEHSTF